MDFLKKEASDIVKILKEKNKTLSTAESCTGGFISSTITDIPGASKVFVGGVTVYTTEIKRKILKISEDVFQYGIISYEMAESMAMAVKSLTGSDFSIATTGNLGPDTMEGKPVGLIFVAVATADKIYIKELNLKGNRAENKTLATIEALKLLKEVLR